MLDLDRRRRTNGIVPPWTASAEAKATAALGRARGFGVSIEESKRAPRVFQIVAGAPTRYTRSLASAASSPLRDRSLPVASTNCTSAAPAASQSKGIWFGSHCFSEPELLPCSVPAASSGVYAILVRDPACHPRMLRAIYFGESGNLSAHLTPWHKKYASWCEEASGAINLYVAFVPMESSTPEDRAAVLSALIAQYQPACNVSPQAP